MNKRLEQLLERIPHWPSEAQEDAIATLESIEYGVIRENSLTAEQREAKLNALRDMVNASIERGGDYTPEDIDAMIDERFGQARAQGR